MIRHVLNALIVFVAVTVLCGAVYPLLITVITAAAFPRQAGGSLRAVDGRVVGSDLIAQGFRTDSLFHPRPSAVDHQPLPSGASNLAPTSRKLFEAAAVRRTRFLDENGLPGDTPVPADMLCASGSGIDPHISLAAARLQCSRVSRARGYDSVREQGLRQFIERSAEYPFLADPDRKYVNVFLVNLTLCTAGQESLSVSESR